MSIDQVRKSLLSRSLVQIAAQPQKIFLEMATMKDKRCELDVMAQSRSAQQSRKISCRPCCRIALITKRPIRLPRIRRSSPALSPVKAGNIL